MIVFENTIIGHHQPLISIESLSLQTGAIYALIGRNGAGKSSLLHTMTGHVTALAGHIYINGHEVHTFQKNSRLRAEQIAFVTSTFTGVEVLTLRAYVSLGRIPYLGALGRMRTLDHQIVDAALEQLNIAHLASSYTNQLSDGERQLASLARAFVQDTPLLILDEPTSFLDIFNKKLLVEQLQRWVASKANRTVILSSHDLDNCLEQGFFTLVLANKKLKLIEAPSKHEVLEQLEE